jgi:hypothetical protein
VRATSLTPYLPMISRSVPLLTISCMAAWLPWMAGPRSVPSAMTISLFTCAKDGSCASASTTSADRSLPAEPSRSQRLPLGNPFPIAWAARSTVGGVEAPPRLSVKPRSVRSGLLHVAASCQTPNPSAR